MQLNRRAFTSGALSAALATQLPSGARAEASPGAASALGAIRSFAQADLSFNRLPAMTLGVTTGEGSQSIMNFGFANADARTPIGPQTLFQVGSISKAMVATVVHQLAAEGHLRLSDRISALLPAIPLPVGNRIEVQHLLDHVSGLADDAPLFSRGGLWTAYEPGAHWHYSNTGYEILGKLIEQVTGQSLAHALRDRIFNPLGMNGSRGAIIDSERTLYAQGYEAADRMAVYTRGAALAPAPWVDITAGAGCVGSTAGDMLLFLRAIAKAVQGKGGLGLSAQQALVLTSRAVASNTPAMTYGNGLMHLVADGRNYLHHTGGMLSFSSSFHVDIASGIAAFASAPISAFADYRPRLLTRFAVDALTDAMLGRPVRAAPPLELGLPNAASYLGRYSGPRGAIEVRPGSPLTIVADGHSAPLVPVAEEIFRTLHPSFREFSLLFERSSGAVTIASWGPHSYVRDGTGASAPVSDPALARLAGRYINDNPWYGPMPVVERGGQLWVGTETPMTSIGNNLWRVGKEEWSPERASFADFIDQRPQSFFFSGAKFPRHEV